MSASLADSADRLSNWLAWAGSPLAESGCQPDILSCRAPRLTIDQDYLESHPAIATVDDQKLF
jgi:hypothetical protein